MNHSVSNTTDARLIRLLNFLQQDPDNLNLINDALALSIDTNDTHHGLQLIEHAQARQLHNAEFYAKAAHVLLMSGDYQNAAIYGNQALLKGIDHPAVVFNTAYAQFYNHKYKQCTELLAPLTHQADCTLITLLLYARALHHQERIEEAQQAIQIVLDKDPRYVEAKGLLALLHYDADNNSAALTLGYETLHDNPDQLDALLACSAAEFEQDNIEVARRLYTHTVEVHPHCGRAWSGLAQIEFNELDFSSAEAHLHLAVKYMPNHIGTWHVLAWIYILNNNSHAAREALNQSYDIDHNFGETHGGFAVVDVMDGYYDRAQKHIKRALRLDAQGMAAQYAQMLMLQQSGQTQAAESLMNQILSRPVSDVLTGHDLVARQLKRLKTQS